MQWKAIITVCIRKCNQLIMTLMKIPSLISNVCRAVINQQFIKHLINN